MKTITKVAIGCGVVVVVGGIVAIVALGGAAWWLKGKAESMVADQQKIEELQKAADRTPFTRPADGVLEEARLQKFLEIRKRVYAVYERNKDEIEAMGQKKQADLGDVRKTLGLISELRLALAQAQADLGMSTEEYAYMVESVYKTLWAAEIDRSTGGKSVSEAMGDLARQAEQAMREARQAAREGGAPEAEEEVAQAQEQAQQALGQAMEEARTLDVPPANIELFRKYESEIKKYAMGGLELMGL